MEVRYVEISGIGQIELPPMFVGSSPQVSSDDNLVKTASDILETSKIRKALELSEAYNRMTEAWTKGRMIWEWIHHCKHTFDTDSRLQKVLPPEIWPLEGMQLAMLAKDKGVVDGDFEVALASALMFPKPIEMSYLERYLIRSHRRIFTVAFRSWIDNAPRPLVLLPPDRFHFEVVNLYTTPFPNGL